MVCLVPPFNTIIKIAIKHLINNHDLKHSINWKLLHMLYMQGKLNTPSKTDHKNIGLSQD